MGALSMTGKNGDQTDGTPADDIDEGTESAESKTRDEGGRFVPAADLVPESAASRRERQWKERVETHVKPLREEWESTKTTYETRLSESDRRDRERAEEIARLRGMIEATQRQGTQQQRQEPAGPDPEKLRAEADAALDAGNVALWRAKDREATRAEIQHSVAEIRKELVSNRPQQQQQGMPFEMQQLMIQHPNVAKAGKKGIRLLMRAEEDMEDDGVRQGWDRTGKAFAKVEADLIAKAKASAAPARPQYSQEGASALAARPTNRPTGGGTADADDGVTLNDHQEAAWKAGGFKSRAEYLKWGDPHKNGLLKNR